MSIKETYNGQKSRLKNWLYDHFAIKTGLDYALAFLVSTISATFFAVGFSVFMDPGLEADGILKLVSGGMSGISQVLVLIFHFLGWDVPDPHMAYSIMYFLLNIPLIVLAWFGIGKRFSIFTLINVIESSLLLKVITPSVIPGIRYIAEFVNNNGGMLARALFAGMCTGISSALAYRFDFSTGGIDVVAYYIALRKSVLVGKYNTIINFFTVTCFTLLTCAEQGWAATEVGSSLGRVFYTVIYLFATMLVVDSINIRNKKVKVEIISARKDLTEVLIDSIPHGATLVQGQGVYTGEAKYIITIVVSSYEVADVVKIVQKEDPGSFVQVIPLSQVYGRFFMKPIK